jgi:protein-S-isoprenylcysteine O-methyltransferase Ste14
MHAARIIVALWALWALGWFSVAWWSSKTEASVGMRRELGYRIVLAVGTIVLFVPAHGYEGPLRLWHVGHDGAWACIAVMLVGFAFCWWARVHLGRFWSGQVTKKEGHRVVDTGPYGLVRHPIYTGVLVAVLGTAVAKGTILGVVGAALMTIGLVMKARLEETWLVEQLGPDYDAYRRRVPMLVPFA